MSKIIINRGSFKLDEVVFEQGITTIGRANNNAIILDDNAVSSHHAKIVTLFNTSYIEDLDSTNGTLVNGKTVQKRTLHSGDIISLGNHQLLFQSDENRNKDTDEVSDTVMLQGNEIKQKLSEFLQSQAELQQSQPSVQSPGTPDAAKAAATPGNNINASQKSAVNPASWNNSSAVSGGKNSASLDKEKNRAWLEGKNIHKLEAKMAAAKAQNSRKTKPEMAETYASYSSSEQPPPNVRNTAAAIKSGINYDTSSHQEITTDSAMEKNPVDIATAARSALQNRRAGDPGTANSSTNTDARKHAPVGAPNNAITLNHRQPSKKVLPMIWFVIVAVLIAEVIYITYRSMG